MDTPTVPETDTLTTINQITAVLLHAAHILRTDPTYTDDDDGRGNIGEMRTIIHTPGSAFCTALDEVGVATSKDLPAISAMLREIGDAVSGWQQKIEHRRHEEAVEQQIAGDVAAAMREASADLDGRDGFEARPGEATS